MATQHYPSDAMDRGRFPDFFIIGAAKAGSTALWHALRRHPGVYLPAVKEPSYFAYKGHSLDWSCPGVAQRARTVVTDEQAYRQLFCDCPPGSRAGEASVGYLASSIAPRELAAAVPGARLVTVLRQPADRAFSHWLFSRQRGFETIADFEEAMAAAPARLAAGWRPSWDYLEHGRYGKHLDLWLRHFDTGQLLILLYEDWLSRPQETLRQVCRHIGVEPREDLPVTRENTTHALRWPVVQRWMSADTPLRRMAHRILPARVRDAVSNAVLFVNSRSKPRLDPAIRARLLEVYAADIDRVEAITGRDLSAWRT